MEQKLTDKILDAKKIIESSNIGFFTGKMGLCLALYLLNKKYCIPQAENAADNLMSQICEQAKKIWNINFDSGLPGIGYGINMLSKYNCIEGDIDDILHDIDAILYRELTTYKFQVNNTYTTGLIGMGLYLVSRLNNPAHQSASVQHRLIEAALRIVIDKLYDTAPSVLGNISKDLYICALWDSPLIFCFMAKAFDVGVYQEKIKAMVRSWCLYIQGSLPYYNINKLALVFSLTYLNKRVCNQNISRHIDLLLTATDFDEIPNEVEYHVTNINEGWMYVLLLLEKAKGCMPKSHPKYSSIEKCRKRIVEECQAMNIHILKEENINVTFIGGLSGIAVMYSLFPEVFKEMRDLF